MVPKPLAQILALLTLTSAAGAHDMWLIPPRGCASKKETSVVLSVGMDFPQSTTAIQEDRVQCQLLGPSGEREPAPIKLTRQEKEKRTVASFLPREAGAWVFGTTTHPKVLKLEAKKFNDYLLHDGLLHIYKQRFDADELQLDAVERYSKYTKCLLQVDDSNAGQATTQPLGQKLEIVPLQNPLARSPGQTLRLQVLFDGAPLARANLCWDRAGNGEDFVGQTWTDAQGKALVPIANSGLFTVRLIHMTRPKHAEYEWESFWASLTWHVPESVVN